MSFSTAPSWQFGCTADLRGGVLMDQSTELHLESPDVAARVRAIRSRLPGQMLQERLERAMLEHGPLYSLAEVRVRIGETLPWRFGYVRGVLALAQEARSVRQHHFEGRPHLRLEEMAAVRGPVAFADDHVGMDRQSILAERDVPDERQHLDLLADGNLLVRASFATDSTIVEVSATRAPAKVNISTGLDRRPRGTMARAQPHEEAHVNTGTSLVSVNG